MNENYSYAEHSVAPLSEAKQRLLEAYLRNGNSAHASRQPQISSPRHPLTGSVRIRELSLEDYPQVIALESSYGLGQKSYEQWSHVWVNNPTYRELRGNWPIGWVLENEDKQIVGAHGNIPLYYEFRGRRIIAAQGRGLVVDLPYRGYSLWPLMAFWEQQNVELCLYTSANPQTTQDDSALGGVRVPAGSWDRNVFWITNYRGCLSVWLKRKIPPRISFLIEPLCLPLAAALFTKDTVAGSLLHRVGIEVLPEFQASFDDRFDEFWESLRKENPDVLLAVRTRETLEWHFAYALLQNKLWIWTITRNSRMSAYALFLKTAKFGITRVSLVDFQALRGNSAFLRPILSAALERCRAERIHLLDNPGLSFGETGINEVAPYHKGVPWSYFFKARDPKLAEALSNPSAWRPSLYDGDASIL